MMSRSQRASILLPVALLAPRGLAAQDIVREPAVRYEAGPVRGEFTFDLILAIPVGEFGDYVDVGGGLGGSGVLYLDDRERLGLRLDGSWIVYGSNTVRRRLSPTIPFVDVDVTTRNWIGSAGFGPQLTLGEGAVRPYVRASVGFSYFATTTSVEGTYDAEPFASSTNFDDVTYALGGGAGVRVDLARARHNPVSLDVGVGYVRHGLTEYLREGGLRETPGGGIEIEAIRSRTDLLAFHLGVVIGLR